MPYAIFRYPPEDEFAVRKEVTLLRTRLEQAGKRVTTVSLAECMTAALDAKGLTTEALAEAEKIRRARDDDRDHPRGPERATSRSTTSLPNASPTMPTRFVTSSSSCARARSSHLSHLVAARAAEGQGARSRSALLSR